MFYRTAAHQYAFWLKCHFFFLTLPSNQSIMKKHFLVAVLCLLTLPQVKAQPGGIGRMGEPNVITIFSENNDFFYVVINGVTENIRPQSFVRIEGITQAVNEIQINFTDGMTRPIRKTITVGNPLDREAVNFAMVIVHERDGDARLRLARIVPREQSYQPQQGEYVMFNGQDVDRGLNNGGDRDRYRDHDRGMNGNGSIGITMNQSTPPPPPPVPAGPTPMDDQTFQSVKQTIASSSFDDSKLSTAKTVANSNFFTTDQVMQICALFSFDDSKLAFAKYAYKRTVDNNMYFRVNDVFSFDNSKKSLNDYVNSNH